jgi:transcriptional regulator with XRE-family HTH domain
MNQKRQQKRADFGKNATGQEVAALMNFIKKYRRDNGMTMAALGEECRVSSTTIWKMERGIAPKYSIRKKIALGLGMKLQDFNALIDPINDRPGRRAA